MPEPATPVTTTSTPSGMSTSTSRRLCVDAPRISSDPVGVRTAALSAARSSRCRPVSVPLALRPSTPPSKQTVAARRSRTGAEIDDVVRDRDRVRLVLDHEHGVPLVSQPEQQGVHPLDIVRMQAGGGLVEDVGDVRQRGAELADHLDALRLPARQRARRAVEREVAEADLRERVERLLQRREQRRHRWLVEVADPSARSLICIAHASAMLIVPMREERAPSLSRVPSHAGQVANVTARSTKARTWGCSDSMSFERNRFCTCRTRPS